MLTIASLFLLATEAQSNELDNLLNASSAIVSQIDRGIKLAGAGYGYANVGGALSNGQLAGTAKIRTGQLNAYNAALEIWTPTKRMGMCRRFLKLRRLMS